MFSRTFRITTLLVVLAAVCSSALANNPLDPGSQKPSQNPLSKPAPQAVSPWAGTFTSPWEFSRMQIVERDNGGLQGEIVGSGKTNRVELRVSGKKLEGAIVAGSDGYPLTVEIGEEPGQIVVRSGNSMYELGLEGGAAAAPVSVKCDPESVPGANFRHPQGYFRLKMPTGWKAQD